MSQATERADYDAWFAGLTFETPGSDSMDWAAWKAATEHVRERLRAEHAQQIADVRVRVQHIVDTEDDEELRGCAEELLDLCDHLGMSLRDIKGERDLFRSLLNEWHEGAYSGGDFLRRVKLALHKGQPRVSLASLRGIAKRGS